MNVMDVYDHLAGRFERKDWWPRKHFFHPREFEICVGAILTQNTNWKNVEKALENLSEKRLTSPERMVGAGLERLEKAVMPSGFYRQKAERLRMLADFIKKSGGFDAFAENRVIIDNQNSLYIRHGSRYRYTVFF